MFMHSSLIASVIAIAMLPNAFAQQAPEIGSVKLYRYGDLLRKHGIELTEPSLLRALENPDADVEISSCDETGGGQDRRRDPGNQRGADRGEDPP